MSEVPLYTYVTVDKVVENSLTPARLQVLYRGTSLIRTPPH